MSADYYLEVDVGGPEPYTLDYDINITYNLGPMLREAGFPPWGALRGLKAKNVAPLLAKVEEALVSDPRRFYKFNPPNGWGDYASCKAWVGQFRLLCEGYPEATIGAWL